MSRIRHCLILAVAVVSVLALGLAHPSRVRAHETRPAYLEIKETAPIQYELFWRTPVSAGMRLPVILRLPTDTKDLKPPTSEELTDSLVEQRWISVPGGITQKRIDFPGLESTIADVVVHVELLDGRAVTTIVHPSRPWVEIPASETRRAVVADYVLHGIRHIALGADHLLFLLGLLLIVKDRWMLLKTVTAFTVAHSLTLALATLGYANAPIVPLNAAIALSILFLGPEIVRSWRGQSSFTIRHPIAARFRVCKRTHELGPAALGVTPGASELQCGRRTGPAFVRSAGLIARTGFSDSRDSLAALGRARSGLHCGIAWGVLDGATRADPFGSNAMSIDRQTVLARCGALLPSLFLLAQAAEAHVNKGEAIGFFSGLKHPISGLDHVIAMIAVGLWGAQLGAPAIWMLPVAFPLVMAMGGMLGLLGLPLPGVEIGIAASAILLGAAVLMELRPPLALAAALVGFFAVFHGYAHGSELPAGESGLLYSIGFVVATGCLHGVGITIGVVHRWGWGQRAIRVTGAAIALAGVFFLWRAFV